MSIGFHDNDLISGDNSVFLSVGAGQEPGPVWVTNDGPWTVVVTPLQMTSGHQPPDPHPPPASQPAGPSQGKRTWARISPVYSVARFV